MGQGREQRGNGTGTGTEREWGRDRDREKDGDYPTKRYGFPQYRDRDRDGVILSKGMPFCRIICGQSKPNADHTVERHAFPLNNPQKVNTFCGL
jgi:hypothetical protein